MKVVAIKRNKARAAEVENFTLKSLGSASVSAVWLDIVTVSVQPGFSLAAENPPSIADTSNPATIGFHDGLHAA